MALLQVSVYDISRTMNMHDEVAVDDNAELDAATLDTLAMGGAGAQAGAAAPVNYNVARGRESRAAVGQLSRQRQQVQSPCGQAE